MPRLMIFALLLAGCSDEPTPRKPQRKPGPEKLPASIRHQGR